MADETTNGPLQFDRVETSRPPAGAGTAQPTVTCGACGNTIRTRYFALGGATICEYCKTSLQRSSEAAQSWLTFLKASAFGLAAAVAGAIVYYGVIAITNFEIGLVAILIGYMVGFGVRKATRGFGGIRYQVLALSLTYFAVGLAYVPLVFSQARDEASAAAPAESEPATPDPTPAPSPAVETASDVSPIAAEPVGFGGFLKGVAVLFLIGFTLPALAVVSTMPSGLISALIIGLGMRQAWQMTGAPAMDVTGPYKVGAAPATT